MIVLVLAIAALAVGWPNSRESALGLLPTGRCDHHSGRWRGAGCVEDPELREQRRRGGWLAVVRRAAALAPSPRLA